MDQPQRVVVTGIGLLSPLGADEASLRERLFAGRSAIGPLRSLDASAYRSRHAAEVDPALLAAALTEAKLRPGDRTTDMAMLTAGAALAQAGLLPTAPGSDGKDTAVLFGTGSGPSHALQESWDAWVANGGRGLRPTTVPRCMLNVVSSAVSIRFGLEGSNYTLVSACSSSTIAIGAAYRMVRHGYARRVLCGGSESMFTPALYASWDCLGVMSRAAEAERACRPFDLDRDGFVLGEGAGALVLESLDEARRRGATIRAEVLGFGESSDGTHITRPSVDGQAAAMRSALQSAGLGPAAIDFVSAHGTATKANDACEAEAIRRVFAAEADRVPVLSTKSYFGHLLGAAGVVETIAAIACLDAGRLHANLNLDRPDPACEIRTAGVSALAVPLRTFMKNSFGFGGSNSTLIVRKYEER
ncbi:MAG: beta-ketoacyl-[acyl-carrier-protein] synthase family protein [Planctomycetes bacterium]|nr:beta-ketoacyl-[acyl-carrier-protein] synthase family protein [Planctomycetota bacterium]